MGRRLLWPALAMGLVMGLALPLAAAPSPKQPLGRLASAWSRVQTYTCTITEHEVKGDRSQNRVYHMFFRKPHDTRLDIVKGPGAGSALVWHGGAEARGHEGGWLRFLKQTVSIHDPRATSLRGTTIAQANFGYLLHHVRSLDTSSVHAATHDGETEMDAIVADPSSDGGISREVLVLGPSGLPVQYRQVEGHRVVREVSYSDVKVNVSIPRSTFSL